MGSSEQVQDEALAKARDEVKKTFCSLWNHPLCINVTSGYAGIETNYGSYGYPGNFGYPNTGYPGNSGYPAYPGK